MVVVVKLDGIFAVVGNHGSAILVVEEENLAFIFLCIGYLPTSKIFFVAIHRVAAAGCNDAASGKDGLNHESFFVHSSEYYICDT